MTSIISKYNPWSVFKELNGDLNQLLENQDKIFGNSTNQDSNQYLPRVDIKEGKLNYTITADFPGVKPEDLEITIENNVLSIKGLRTIERNLKEDNFSRIERFSGSFYRQFNLPDHVDNNEIKATIKHGVLEIIVPKKERHLPRKISVKSDE